MKLNLGCGNSKIDGFVNVDIDAELKPDKVFDFRGEFPYKENSIEVITMYHVIEHIEKKHHDQIFSECHRVLTPGGILIVTYPEFLKCVENWKENKKGMREFWEATLFGRQLTRPDYHVCIIDTDQLSIRLVRKGFEITHKGSEPGQDFNSVIKARKVDNLTYEDGLVKSIGLKRTYSEGD